MKQKITILKIFLIFLILYLGSDFLISCLISMDNNLEVKNVCYEEEYNSLKKEYDELLNYTSNMPNNIISKVIEHDPLTFFAEVKILKGKKEGILKDSMVFNEQGLVGIVSKVMNHTSMVQLLPNKNTKIAVKIGDIDGLLESDNGVLKVKNITSSNQILENTEVKSSNYSLLESGVVIGTVKEVYKTNQNLSTEVIIEPSVDFNHLNYVSVKMVKKDD